jgi:hypothetical protein
MIVIIMVVVITMIIDAKPVNESVVSFRSIEMWAHNLSTRIGNIKTESKGNDAE